MNRIKLSFFDPIRALLLFIAVIWSLHFISFFFPASALWIDSTHFKRDHRHFDDAGSARKCLTSQRQYSWTFDIWHYFYLTGKKEFDLHYHWNCYRSRRTGLAFCQKCKPHWGVRLNFWPLWIFAAGWIFPKESQIYLCIRLYTHNLWQYDYWSSPEFAMYFVGSTSVWLCCRCACCKIPIIKARYCSLISQGMVIDSCDFRRERMRKNIKFTAY